jgi:hypothetical protein
VSGSNLFAGTRGGGVFLSTNNGTSWTQKNNGLNNNRVLSLAVSGTNLFAGTDSGAYLSTNNGTSWILVAPIKVYSLAVNGTNVFAGTLGSVFFSTDNGASWNQKNYGLPISNVVAALTISGTNIFAGTIGGGLFVSTNNGTDWTQIGTNGNYYYSFTVGGNDIFGGASLGVNHITKNVNNWAAISIGLWDFYIYSLAFDGTNIYAGTNKAGVWSRPLSEVVSVCKDGNNLPKEFALSQNFPNPFNPSTTINYSLVKQGHVKITVYNLFGSKVSVIVDENKPAGNYAVHFNGSSLASGIYFYRLESGGYTSVKKFILMK